MFFSIEKPYIIFDYPVSPIEIKGVRDILFQVYKRIRSFDFSNLELSNRSPDHIKKTEYDMAFIITIGWLVGRKPLFFDFSGKDSYLVIAYPSLIEFPSSEERLAAIFHLQEISETLQRIVKQYKHKEMTNLLTGKERIIFQKMNFYLNVSIQMNIFIQYMNQTEMLIIPEILKSFLSKTESEKLKNLLYPENQSNKDFSIIKKSTQEQRKYIAI